MSWFSLKSLFSLTIFFNMPQPKWYNKSLAELCMDSIVDNMEKWTALRSSEHVSSLFYLLRKCFFFNNCVLSFDYAILTNHSFTLSGVHS